MKRTLTIDYTLRPPPAEHDPARVITRLDAACTILDRYPTLALAAAAVDRDGHGPILVTRIEIVADLIAAMGTPGVPTLYAILAGDLLVGVAEYELLRDLLPTHPGDTRVRFEGDAHHALMCFSRSMKRSAWGYRVTFRHISRDAPGGGVGGFFFPLEVRVAVWADMDDPENHQEDCPTRRSEWDAEDHGDCTCEPATVVDKTWVIPGTTDPEWPWLKTRIARTIART